MLKMPNSDATEGIGKVIILVNPADETFGAIAEYGMMLRKQIYLELSQILYFRYIFS